MIVIRRNLEQRCALASCLNESEKVSAEVLPGALIAYSFMGSTYY